MLKAISYLTEWALPEKRMVGRTETNFDYQKRLPELPPSMAQSSAPASTEKVASEVAVTRYVSPFNLAFDTQLGFFPWFELPENEGRLLRFGHAMVGTRQCEVKNQILQGTTETIYVCVILRF